MGRIAGSSESRTPRRDRRRGDATLVRAWNEIRELARSVEKSAQKAHQLLDQLRPAVPAPGSGPLKLAAFELTLAARGGVVRARKLGDGSEIVVRLSSANARLLSVLVHGTRAGLQFGWVSLLQLADAYQERWGRRDILGHNLDVSVGRLRRELAGAFRHAGDEIIVRDRSQGLRFAPAVLCAPAHRDPDQAPGSSEE